MDEEKNNVDAAGGNADTSNNNGSNLQREAPESLQRPTFINPKGDLKEAKRRLSDIITELDPPVFFNLGGRITRIKGYELDSLGTMGVRSVFDERVRCLKENDKGAPTIIYPPSEIAQAISATPELFGVQELKYFTNVPTIFPDGTIAKEAGYYPDHKAYYTGKFTCENVPGDPTAEDVQNAIETIYDVLCDFPFLEQSDRVHVLALLLSLSGRLLIDGCIPPFMISASTAGTGKSKLTDVVSLITQGFVSGKAVWPTNEDEMNKQLITQLASGNRYIIFDNVNGKIDSGTFAAFTTSQIYEGRYLGGNKKAKLDNYAVVTLTANNPTMSQEVARRFITIDLMAQDARPEDRTGFKHSNLIRYVLDNQAKLLASVLTLWKYWICQGKPRSKHQLGSFEIWSETVGGVLELVGIPGFLANRERVREKVDVESEMWNDFVTEWHRIHGSNLVTATQIYELCRYDVQPPHELDFIATSPNERDEMLLGDVILPAMTQRAAVSRIGRALANKINGTFNAYRICLGGKQNGVKRYFLS